MKRIYVVTELATSNKALISATTRAGALNFVARSTLSAALASQHDIVALLRAGIDVQEADAPAQIDVEEQIETAKAPESLNDPLPAEAATDQHSYTPGASVDAQEQAPTEEVQGSTTHARHRKAR
jgi:hypothetical protein